MELRLCSEVWSHHCRPRERVQANAQGFGVCLEEYLRACHQGVSDDALWTLVCACGGSTGGTRCRCTVKHEDEGLWDKLSMVASSQQVRPGATICQLGHVERSAYAQKMLEGRTTRFGAYRILMKARQRSLLWDCLGRGCPPDPQINTGWVTRSAIYHQSSFT